MISKEQFLELKHLKALGVPTTRIAQKIGISVPNANKWLRLDEEAFDNYIKANTPYLDQYRAFILNILKVCPQTQATNIMYRIKDRRRDVCKHPAGRLTALLQSNLISQRGKESRHHHKP